MKLKLIAILTCLLASQAFPRIRVGYIVTSAAAARMPNVYNWVATANAFMNQSFQNTGFPQPNDNVSSVLGYMRVDPYNEAGASYQTHLNRLENTLDGHMDYAINAMVQYGLDVMVLVTDDSEACGRAKGIAPAFPFLAATYWACDEAAAYSNIGHEIGHLHGARHAPNQDGSNTTIDGTSVAYVHGYCDATNGFADIMTGNYTSCPSTATRRNYYSNPRMLQNGFAAGEATRSDVARLYTNYFYRVSNGRSIAAGMTRCVEDFHPDRFQDIVATGNIVWHATSPRCIAHPGSRTHMRVAAAHTVSFAEFEAREGSELRVIVGGSDPLTKPAVPGPEAGEPDPAPAAAVRRLSGRFEGGRLHVGGTAFAGGAVRLEIFDLKGKRLHEAALRETAMGGGASLPWSLGMNRAVFLRFALPGNGSAVRRIVALEGAAFSMD